VSNRIKHVLHTEPPCVCSRGVTLPCCICRAPVSYCYDAPCTPCTMLRGRPPTPRRVVVCDFLRGWKVGHEQAAQNKLDTTAISLFLSSFLPLSFSLHRALVYLSCTVLCSTSSPCYPRVCICASVRKVCVCACDHQPISGLVVYVVIL
jgi:hypothetical protein